MFGNMKRLLFLIGFLAFAVQANDVIFFNPSSYPVANRVLRYAPSLNEPDYYNVAGALIITNAAVQKGAGVNLTNITTDCVVQGQQVRLMNAGEYSLIASNQNWFTTNQAALDKIAARVVATNVVNGSDGWSLYIRAMGEANWFFLNYIRTNDGKAALPRSNYVNQINSNINAFGQ